MEKIIKLKGSASALDYYFILQRGLDNFTLDNADMTFKAPATVGIDPVQPLIELAIDAVLTQIYEFRDNTAIWNDGTYQITFYQQLGALPAPTTDTVLVVGTLVLRGNEIIERSYTHGEGG